MTIYGYARVSTKDQTLASQDAQLREAGCAKVYSEKISGVRSDRPELAKVLKRLEPWRPAHGHPARSAGALDQGSAQCAGRGCQGWRGFQVIGRCMGGYDDTARQAHADDAWRAGRVRAFTDPCAYKRRQIPRKSPWREIWPPAFRPSVRALRGLLRAKRRRILLGPTTSVM